jgi:uncharacterized protein (TIRG00374 family)
MEALAGKPEPSWRRVAVGVAHLLVLGVLLLLGWRFTRRLDFELLRTRIGEVGPAAFTLMIVGLLARLPLWTERWLFGIRCAGLHADRLRSMGALAASMAVNTLTPTARVAGGLVRARFLAADARSGFGVAYGTVVVDQLVHHVGMGVLSFVAVAWAAGERAPRWSLVSALVAAAALLLGGVVWLRWRGGGAGAAGGAASPSVIDRLLAGTRRSLEKQAARQPRLGSALAGGGDALEVVARLLRAPRVVVSAALLGTALFLVGGVVQWLAFRALDLPVGLGTALAVVGIGGFAGVASGTPGGAGGAEAAMIATLAALGVSTVDATVATLLFRGLHYVVVLGVGLPSLALLEWLRARGRGAVSG